MLQSPSLCRVRWGGAWEVVRVCLLACCPPLLAPARPRSMLRLPACLPVSLLLYCIPFLDRQREQGKKMERAPLP